MKGALETLTDYMYLIIAIVIGGLMFYFIAQTSGLFSSSNDDTAYGDSAQVSKRLATEIENCWNKHRGGLDSLSDVCIEIQVNATQNFSEWTVTKNLDCAKIPNNYCSIGNCSFCFSPHYDDNDRVGWSVKNRNAFISISYSGSERRIMVQEIAPGKQLTPGSSNSTSKLWVTMIYPKKGYSFKYPATINFKSSAGGGAPPYTMQWSSNTTGHLGNDSNITVTNLAVGNHTLSLHVSDSQGGTISTSATIEILDATSMICPKSKDVSEGGSCNCSDQCKIKLECGEGHCCQSGSLWSNSENKCVKGADVLIVALRGNMKKVYSDVQIAQLDAKVEEYRAALSEDGLGSRYIYLDDASTSSLVPGGKIVTSPSSWKDIDSVLDLLIPKLSSKYLVILGGYSRFPQPEFSTGACDDPYYTMFQSDDAYADFSPKDDNPDIPVGRIPDPNNGDINALLKPLDTYIALHKSGGLDLGDTYFLAAPRVGSGCRYDTAAYCLGKIIGVASYADSVSYSVLSGHKWVFLQEHGSNTVPQYFQSDPCGGTFRLTSTNVPALTPTNSVWMIGACYSSYLKNKDSTSNSIPIQFLSNGGAIYFGGTLTQFTYSFTTGTECDSFGGGGMVATLYVFTANHMKIGARIGDAYLTGKKDYLTKTDDDSGCRYRQGHENLLYGDPTLKIKNMPN